MDNQQRIQRYVETLNARDWIAFGALLHEDVLYEVPQTRERVRGREAYLDFNMTFLGDWTLQAVRVIANALRGCAEISFRVSDQVMPAIAFFEFKDGLIARITDYWPDSYEPPARASKFVERD
jgi:ketosteroid isomerase-like protein